MDRVTAFTPVEERNLQGREVNRLQIAKGSEGGKKSTGLGGKPFFSRVVREALAKEECPVES